MSEDKSRRLRTPKAAAYVGLAPRTLEKMRLTGGGPPFYKLGRAVVYDTFELDIWLGECIRRNRNKARQHQCGQHALHHAGKVIAAILQPDSQGSRGVLSLMLRW